MSMYIEEQCFWIYKDDVPFKRMSRTPEVAEVIHFQHKFPTSTFKIVKEERSVTEIKSFSPLQQKYTSAKK